MQGDNSNLKKSYNWGTNLGHNTRAENRLDSRINFVLSQKKLNCVDNQESIVQFREGGEAKFMVSLLRYSTQKNIDLSFLMDDGSLLLEDAFENEFRYHKLLKSYENLFDSRNQDVPHIDSADTVHSIEGYSHRHGLFRSNGALYVVCANPNEQLASRKVVCEYNDEDIEHLIKGTLFTSFKDNSVKGNKLYAIIKHYARNNPFNK